MNETLSRREPTRLERMEALLADLGNPQLTYPTIHVGGTSGKGSTSTMIAAALSTAGLKCGLHTKPHLVSMTERARINNVPISETAFCEMLDDIMPALERTTARFNRPSYYETLLALTFYYFQAAQVDIAVIEVGIGGRLDGTNLLAPLVSTITNVGLDHREILGDTIEEIALDKAGIIKPGIPLVSDAVTQAREIIEAVCREQQAPFFSVRDLVTIEPQVQSTMGQHFVLATPQARYDIATQMLGSFQQRNAATAVLTLEQLPETFRPEPAVVEAAFAHLAIMGRMEYFPLHPAVVFDVAHNPDKMRSLVESVRAAFVGRRLHFVIAIAQDKEAREMLAGFDGLDASFIFTSFETAGRDAVRPTRLAGFVRDSGRWVRAIEDPIEAFTVARRSAASDDVIIVTGSTVLVGLLRSWFLKNTLAASM